VQHNASIANGQLWRLITPTFLHGNIVHLVLNGAALNNLGPLVETVSGRSRFLAVYTVAAVAGVTASYLGSPHLSLGSSGQTDVPIARACSPCQSSLPDDGGVGTLPKNWTGYI